MPIIKRGNGYGNGSRDGSGSGTGDGYESGTGDGDGLALVDHDVLLYSRYTDGDGKGHGSGGVDLFFMDVMPYSSTFIIEVP